MKIISNYLNLSTFNELKKFVFSNELPLFYHDKIVGDESVNETNDFMFNRVFFDKNKQHSDYFNFIMMPILGKLNLNYLIRAKLNCYVKKEKHVHTKMHVDYDSSHTVGLFSFNTCNGYTFFNDTNEKIKSIENQMIIFDGNRKHCSVSQTDSNLRINVNINFI